MKDKPRLGAELEQRFSRQVARGCLGLVAALAVAGLAAAAVKTFVPMPAWGRWLVDFATIAAVYFLASGMVARHLRARTAVGRELIENGDVRQAYAALEPVAAFGNRSFDGTGEGHYWLMVAAERLGMTERAETLGKFLVMHRRGEWADKAARRLIGHPD